MCSLHLSTACTEVTRLRTRRVTIWWKPLAVLPGKSSGRNDHEPPLPPLRHCVSRISFDPNQTSRDFFFLVLRFSASPKSDLCKHDLAGPMLLAIMFILLKGIYERNGFFECSSLGPRLSLISRSFESVLPALGTFHTFQFLSAVRISGNNDCFICLLFLNSLWWIWRSVWMVKSHNSFTSSFSSTLLGECSYHYFVIALKSIFVARLPVYDPPNNLFLYSISLSLGQFPKICCTVSSWLPHILHLDDTFSFTAFVLGAWSKPFCLLLQFTSSYPIPGNIR